MRVKNRFILMVFIVICIADVSALATNAKNAPLAQLFLLIDKNTQPAEVEAYAQSHNLYTHGYMTGTWRDHTTDLKIAYTEKCVAAKDRNGETYIYATWNEIDENQYELQYAVYMLGLNERKSDYKPYAAYHMYQIPEGYERFYSDAEFFYHIPAKGEYHAKSIDCDSLEEALEAVLSNG